MLTISNVHMDGSAHMFALICTGQSIAHISPVQLVVTYAWPAPHAGDPGLTTECSA